MPSIIETAVATNSFKILLSAIYDAGLTETLSGPGMYTFFAPNDYAFAYLPKGSWNTLLKDIPRLRKVLTYHVVEGKHRATDYSQLYRVLTLEGQEIVIGSQQGFRVNDSKVVKADIDCDNGVIHMIDAVLKLPMTISATK